MLQSYKKRSSSLCHYCDYLNCKKKGRKGNKCAWYKKNSKKYFSKRLSKESAYVEEG